MASFSTTAFDVDAFSENAFDFGSAPVVVIEPAGGGRRLKKRREYRPLNKRERAELDRLFQRNAKPAYVAPPASVPTKRTAPVVITLPPDAPRAITRPADRIQAAKQFLALDALESYLDTLERSDAVNAVRVAHLRARQHAQRLADEQERLAREAIAREAQRMADEDELMMLLLLVHDGIVT